MKLIIGVSGASGVILGVELLKALQTVPHCETHLVISRDAAQTLSLETPFKPQEVEAMANFAYPADDLSALIASGSFKTDGMVVVPCSMKTLAAVANGYTENLLQRAADVCLKEGRKVVLVPREAPLNRVHLKNLLAASEAGCVILPPMLTFYHQPLSIQEMIDHLIGKIFQQFDLDFPDFRAWKPPQT
jgi:flavin prenyltransferase